MTPPLQGDLMTEGKNIVHLPIDRLISTVTGMRHTKHPLIGHRIGILTQPTKVTNPQSDQGMRLIGLHQIGHQIGPVNTSDILQIVGNPGIKENPVTPVEKVILPLVGPQIRSPLNPCTLMISLVVH